jgi:hypothetical protein
MMSSKTPMFASMRHLSGSAPRRVRQQLEAQRTALRPRGMSELNAVLERFVDPGVLAPTGQGQCSRQRVFDVATTTQAFLWQALHAQAPCRDAVLQVQASRLAAGQPLCDARTSAYCQARARLPLERLQQLSAALCAKMERLARLGEHWQGREVKVLDGTGLRTEDTASNATAYGYPPGQQPGCGFPVLRLAALFSLSSGAWLGHAVGRTTAHDIGVGLPLVRAHLHKGELLLADRAFSAWWLIALAQEQGADVLVRLHQARCADMRQGTRLGREDRLQVWPKPPRPRRCPLTAEEYAALPQTLSVRVLRLHLEGRGQRTTQVMLATTLRDARTESKEHLAELFARRWQIELNFDDLKTTLGMEHLACKSPALVERSLQVFAGAYNLIRALMLESAVAVGVPLTRLSFKGSGRALALWSVNLRSPRASPRQRTELWDTLLAVVAADLLPLRPDRHEPRAVKRRPKNHPLLTKPRHQFQDIPHRSRYSKKQQNITPLT